MKRTSKSPVVQGQFLRPEDIARVLRDPQAIRDALTPKSKDQPKPKK